MPIISFTPCIYKGYKRGDGTYPVRIRITVNRKSKQLTTSIYATDTQLTKSLKIRDRELQRRVDTLLSDLRMRVADIDPLALPYLTIEDVVRHLENSKKSKPLDFFEFSDVIISEIASRNPKSAKNYRCAVNALRDFCGSASLDILEMTSSFLRRWQRHLEMKHGERARAVSLYTSSVAYIHAQARERYNDEESGVVRIPNPYEFYKPKKQVQAQHRALPHQDIQNLINAYGKLGNNDRITAAMFLFSFGTMGMNLADIFGLEKPDKDRIVTYNRAKTKARRYDRAEMRVRLDPRLQPIIKEFKGDGGKLFRFSRQYSGYVTFYQAICRRLKRTARLAGMSDFTTFYSARHTWATEAYRIGIEKGIINDCLCHVDEAMRVTDIYIVKDWERMWKANEKVLDTFDWSGLLK